MKKLTGYAKQNRRTPTKAEAELRRKLLRWRIRFRSQKPFDFFIVDFLIPDRRLVIEVDGLYHNDTVEYDKRREEYLTDIGLTVIRITNDEVLTTDCERLRKAILDYPTVDLSKISIEKIWGCGKY